MPPQGPVTRLVQMVVSAGRGVAAVPAVLAGSAAEVGVVSAAPVRAVTRPKGDVVPR